MTTVEINDINSQGDGVGDLDGKKVFVQGALPGERVTVSITEEKKRYNLAKIDSLEKASENRVEPICPHFGECGGCQLMHLDYQAQLLWKQQRVENTIKRIAGLDVEVQDCMPSPLSLRYRNKATFHQGGYYKRKTHDIVKIDQCYLIDQKIEKAIPKKSVDKLVIKYSKAKDETLIIEDGKASKEQIIEEIGDLKFAIKPKDFFQVNIEQAKNLYEKALSLAQIEKEDTILDAYCGVGAMSLLAAKHAKKVIGIELGKSAILSARENATLNNISNVKFIQGKVEEKLKAFQGIDIAFINPPRTGVAPTVIEALNASAVKRLIYISCDPATLSRDLKGLSEKYHIKGVYPFDMFPQTTHVETLVCLERMS